MLSSRKKIYFLSKSLFTETSVLSVLGIYPDRLKGELADNNLLWPFPNCHPKRTEWSQFCGRMSIQGRGAYRAELALPFQKCTARTRKSRQKLKKNKPQRSEVIGFKVRDHLLFLLCRMRLCAACMHVCACWNVCGCMRSRLEAGSCVRLVFITAHLFTEAGSSLRMDLPSPVSARCCVGAHRHLSHPPALEGFWGATPVLTLYLWAQKRRSINIYWTKLPVHWLVSCSLPSCPKDSRKEGLANQQEALASQDGEKWCRELRELEHESSIFTCSPPSAPMAPTR